MNVRAYIGRSFVGCAWRSMRSWAWRWVLRNLSPDRGCSMHQALIAICVQMRTDPKSPTVWRGALGVPFQLERRLRAEAEA